MFHNNQLTGFSASPHILTAKNFTLDSDNNNGAVTFTWKTRIASMNAGGLEIQVTFNASNTGSVVCTAAGVGIATTAPSASSITQLFFSGAAGFSLSSGQAITSDWVTFTTAAGNELIISYTTTTSDARQLSVGGDSFYYKGSVSEALTASVAGYTLVSGRTHSVSLVQVR